jgi:hypothetical protein
VHVLSCGAALLAASGTASAQTGDFTAARIGAAPTVARYQPTDQSYTLASQGPILQAETDQLSLACQPLDGDGEVMARISLAAVGDLQGGEAGVIIRESEDPGAPLVAVLASEKAVVLARRLAAGQAVRRATSSAYAAPISLRLVRSGNQFSAWIAETAAPTASSTWKRLGEPQTVEMRQRVLVGLVAAGQGPGATAKLARVSVGSVARGLIHQYSFREGTAKDSIGTAHGQLMGSARISGGKLVLENGARRSGDPSAGYVQFPPTVLPSSGSASIEIWFTCQPLGMWARLLDVGTQRGGAGERFLLMTPRDAEAKARLGYTSGTFRGVDIMAGSPLDDGKLHMVVIVIDGNGGTMRLYVDGRPAGAPVNVGRDALAQLAPEKVWLGRSLFDVDPAFSGIIEDLRVYQTPLTNQEVADHYQGRSR